MARTVHPASPPRASLSRAASTICCCFCNWFGDSSSLRPGATPTSVTPCIFRTHSLHFRTRDLYLGRSSVRTRENKDLVVRLIEEVWNAGALDMLPELWADQTRGEATAMRDILINAFPDLHVE